MSYGRNEREICYFLLFAILEYLDLIGLEISYDLPLASVNDDIDLYQIGRDLDNIMIVRRRRFKLGLQKKARRAKQIITITRQPFFIQIQ